MGAGRLRIAFVAEPVGGPSADDLLSAQPLVERLRARHDVRVIGHGGVQSAARFSAATRGEAGPGPPRALPAWGEIQALLAGVEVVHLQAPSALSRLVLEIARAQHIPVVAAFHVQPAPALYGVGFRSRHANRWLYRRWVGKLYNRADVVWCPTPFAEAKLREHGLTVPVRVIAGEVAPEVSSLVRRPVADGFFKILMLGRLSREQRHADVIEAIWRSASEAHIKLTVVGSGPREKAIRRHALDLQNQAVVGALPRHALLGHLATADLLVHAGEVELEAPAVIAARSIGLPVLVAQGRESAASALALGADFRFPVGNVKLLSQHLDALVARPEVLREAGSHSAAARQGFGAQADELEALYHGLLKQKGGRAPRWTLLPLPGRLSEAA